MRPHGLVATALDRLNTPDLLPAVLGVHSVEREGLETILISIASGTSQQTRNRIVGVLGGLRHECVDVDRPPRGVVQGQVGVKDGQSWRIGTQSEVAWIEDHTAGGSAITSAIPPIFDAYATVVIDDEDVRRRRDEAALLALLTQHSVAQRWWLGYLDTGAHDLVFGDAPPVTLYAGWHYVLMEAGPTQAGTWRKESAWRGRLPDLIFPVDRSWLVSMLWDDDWRCLGGPDALVRAAVAELSPNSRSVSIDEDATPPGHLAR